MTEKKTSHSIFSVIFSFCRSVGPIRSRITGTSDLLSVSESETKTLGRLNQNLKPVAWYQVKREYRPGLEIRDEKKIIQILQNEAVA
jgi:hypothetical protein